MIKEDTKSSTKEGDAIRIISQMSSLVLLLIKTRVWMFMSLYLGVME